MSFRLRSGTEVKMPRARAAGVTRARGTRSIQITALTTPRSETDDRIQIKSRSVRGFRNDQSAQRRGRSIRENCGAAHESAGARTGSRSGLLIQRAEIDAAVKVLVFKSPDPNYFISHVDVARIKENREAAAKLAGDASIGLLLRHPEGKPPRHHRAD